MKPEIKKQIEGIKQKERKYKKEEFKGFTKFEKFVWYLVGNEVISMYVWIVIFINTIGFMYISPNLIYFLLPIFLMEVIVFVVLSLFSMEHKLVERHGYY